MIKNIRIRIKETIANIMCDDLYYYDALKEIELQRNELEQYIERDNSFLISLSPVQENDKMPAIAKEMCTASRMAGVGPMASVAGAISQYGVKKIIGLGSSFGLIDNGGDIALVTDRQLIVGIFTGPAKIKNIGLKIQPDENILGICTSSGIIGHSLSFGKAHAVTVLSHDTLLADSAATAICNECTRKDPVLIEEVLNKYYLDGILGAIVIFDDYFGCIGEIPEICETDIDYKLIAK